MNAVERFEKLRNRLQTVDRMTRAQANSWIAANAPDIHGDYLLEYNRRAHEDAQRIANEAERRRAELKARNNRRAAAGV